MANKKMLLLGASGMANELIEFQGISNQCLLYEISVESKIINSYDDLKAVISESKNLDYIYLSAHGNESGFGDNKNLDVSWVEFAELVQNSHCLNPNAFLLLSTCRGGLNNVAFDLINFCRELQYVCGPKTSLNSLEMLMAFSLFLFNVEYRNMDPTVACQKIMNSTDLRFMCYDRLEVITETAFLLRQGKFEIHPIDENNDGIKDEIAITRRNGSSSPRTTEESELLDQ